MLDILVYNAEPLTGMISLVGTYFLFTIALLFQLSSCVYHQFVAMFSPVQLIPQSLTSVLTNYIQPYTFSTTKNFY